MGKVFLFDNDGVIICGSGEIFSQRVVRDKGADEEKVREFFTQGKFSDCLIGEKDLKRELEIVLPEWGIDEDVDSILKYWFEGENKLDSRFIDLIKRLRESGNKCYLATNNEALRTNYLIENMNYGSIFDGVFSSAFLKCKKPDEKYYREIISLVGEEPKDIFYIDDEEKNILSSSRLGFRTYHYIGDFNRLCVEIDRFLAQ